MSTASKERSGRARVWAWVRLGGVCKTRGTGSGLGARGASAGAGDLLGSCQTVMTIEVKIVVGWQGVLNDWGSGLGPVVGGAACGGVAGKQGCRCRVVMT